MPFKQNNNNISNEDSQVLNDILTAIHQLKSSVDNLNQRINKLESATNNKQIESISANSEQLKKDIDKVSNNSAIQFLIILAITVVIIHSFVGCSCSDQRYQPIYLRKNL